MAHLICKNDEALRKAGVLACQFDTPYCTYLRFITNPRLSFENDPKKSRTLFLLQHLVKAAVIISASPLTTFEIIPFHCSVSTVYRSDSKTSVTL